MNYITDNKGLSISKTNPFPSQLIDASGNVIFSAANPGVLQISGSNTRKWATDTITFGAGAGAHNANEVMSTDAGEILVFPTGLPAGASGIILSSLVTLAAADVFLNGAGYKLHLFKEAPTIIADDAAFTLLVAEIDHYIGFIEIGTIVDYGASCLALDTGHNLDFTLAAADTNLYGQLVCKGTDTTVNGVVMTLNLGIVAL